MFKLVDMSGGLEESWTKASMTQFQIQNFWQILYQGFQRNAIIACDNLVNSFSKQLRRVSFILIIF
jgi:hypothetical protein